MHELLPQVKSITPGTGRLDCAGGLGMDPGGPYASLSPFLAAYVPRRDGRTAAPVTFITDAALSAEAYRLDVAKDGVRIAAATRKGAFYALQTLRQLVQDDATIPAVAIADAPDLPLRGFMMDVSRDKIPSMATLRRFIDDLAAVKMNHFELYVEGFSYAYPSFPAVWREETPLTPADYEELDRYCAEREIDFVPNQNGFGHMSAWLARPEFRSLAEKEDGFVAWGFPFPPSTLNPLDPDSFGLVRTLYGDMLPHCSSRYFNINGDEPFELGLGKSKAECERIGREAVYVGFVKRLCDEAARHGRIPMMWGDVLVNHPDAVRSLPPEVVFIDWGYDHPYPFDEHAAMLAGAGVRFVAAPGTSAWNSFASRRRDMLATTRNAADAVKRHGGLGILQTDWGDFGHLQYLPFSWPGMLEAAGAAWSVPPTEEAVADHLDRFLVPEGAGRLGRAIIGLSRYAEHEREFVYNATTAFKSFMYVDPSPGRDVATATAILAGALAGSRYGLAAAAAVRGVIEAARAAASAAPASLVRDELLQTCDFIDAGIAVNLAFTEPDVSSAEKRRAASLLGSIAAAHAGLWNARNRAGGLARSLSRPLMLKNIMEASLDGEDV